MNKGSLKDYIRYILRIFLFWLLVFALQRAIFLLFNTASLHEPSCGLILASWWYALGMDISTACYIMVLPVLLYTVAIFVKRFTLINKIVNTYMIIVLVVCLAIGFTDISIYANWGSKLNAKAFALGNFGGETAGLIFARQNLWYFILFFLLSGILIWIYYRFFRNSRRMAFHPLATAIIFMIMSGLLFTGIRGGFQKYPLSKSWVYYSKYPVLNNASLNGLWNVVEIVSKPQVTVNPYHYYDDAVASAVVADLFRTSKDTTISILTTTRPNIVLVMMESMSADNYDVLGGEKGIAPCFDSLCTQGLLFTDFYASGFRTDQGLVAMLSGFPAQPASAVIKNFGKFDKMPNLVRTLSDTGYYTSYYCGGNFKFANTDTYLIAAGIDKLSGENEVPYTRRTQWGAYDEDLYNYVISDGGKIPQPFFAVVATITNHEEFDADVEKVFKGGSMTDNYKNTAHYADRAVFDFIQKAGKQSWFRNTLFVITADHAHRYPVNRAYNEPLRHHIPFLLYGDVIKPEFRGTRVNRTASQVDFPATLLAQMKINPAKRKLYHWSNNLFNTCSGSFAFYAFDNGFGFITPASEVVYDHNLGQVVMAVQRVPGAPAMDVVQQGKAYLQKMFDEFIGL